MLPAEIAASQLFATFTTCTLPMSSVIAACPYCNAALPPISAPAPSKHVPCPRCGEPVPSERFPIEHQNAIAAGPPPARMPDTNAAGKRKTLQVVLSIMAGMAAFALVFAIYTQSVRRERDPKPNVLVEAELAPDPTQLLGLDYLPRGTHLVAGLHIARLLKSDQGASLLREPRPELIATMLSALDTVSLNPADVDHCVLGTDVQNLPPLVTMVIVTSKPYDMARIQEAIKQQPCSESAFRSKPLYKLTHGTQIPKVWLAGPRVVVYTMLTTDDLERIPATEKKALEALTAPTRKALTQRIGKQSLVWAVGDMEPAKGLADLALQFGLLPKDQGRLLTLIRTFAVGVSTQEREGLTLTGNFQTADATASLELQKYLEGFSINGAKSKKIELPPADVKDADAQWLTWQVRGDAEAMRSALGLVRLVPWKGKVRTK
jgi:hypothetical protein